MHALSHQNLYKTREDPVAGVTEGRQAVGQSIASAGTSSIGMETLSRQSDHYGIEKANIDRLSPDRSTALLASIYVDLEQLWRDIEEEKFKIEEFRKSLAHNFHPEPWLEVQSIDQSGMQNQSPLVPEYCLSPTSGRRKPAKPVRSAMKYDPYFRGVTVRMKTKLCGGESNLVILSSYSARKSFRPGSQKRRNSAGTADSPSSSDSEDNAQTIVKQTVFLEKLPWRYSSLGGKVCASCGTRKTPLWRDAEDGTPLCNACGIRYKKYRVRCCACWHIPKKDGKSYPHCPCCGSLLTISSCRRVC